jgi:hypothetical protein
MRSQDDGNECAIKTHAVLSFCTRSPAPTIDMLPFSSTRRHLTDSSTIDLMQELAHSQRHAATLYFYGLSVKSYIKSRAVNRFLPRRQCHPDATSATVA